VSSTITFSVVIPILNEEETIPEMLARLDAVIQRVGDEWEVIYINDGSTDRSLEVLREQRRRYPYLRIIDLSRNFGHLPALTAGLDRASGRAVVLMDGDLQDTPETLPRMIEKWREGYEVVYAVRAKRKEGLVKRALFAGFYRLQRRVSRISTPLNAGIFSLIDRRTVNVLRSMPERNRYLPGLRAYAGFRQVGIEVERGPRYRGEPRVKFRQLVKLALDGMFAFSTAPLRFVFLLGGAVSTASLFVAIAGLYYKYVLGRSFLDWPYGLTTAFFFGGVQLIGIGIIGEYVGRIYEEVKQRPYYIARETIGFDSHQEGD
jgi:dolichol-phosphate mannosyltransferase